MACERVAWKCMTRQVNGVRQTAAKGRFSVLAKVVSLLLVLEGIGILWLSVVVVGGLLVVLTVRTVSTVTAVRLRR